MAARHSWRWLGAVATGAGAVAWGASKYRNGEISYVPMRSREWVSEHLASTPAVMALSQNSAFSEIQPISLPSWEKGGVGPTRVFQDKKDRSHTITFVHCGPLACGFPFLVHGGVLGSLIWNALRQAKSVKESEILHGSLDISYRSPTFVNQIIVLETQQSKSGISAKIRSLKNKTLVEAEYKSP